MSAKHDDKIKIYQADTSLFHSGGFDILYAETNIGQEDGILFIISAEASVSFIHYANGKDRLRTLNFDVLQVMVKDSVGWYNGLQLGASLINLMASVFDLNVGFGYSIGFGIKDDSLEFEFGEFGFVIGRRIGISIFGFEIAIDLGRCIIL